MKISEILNLIALIVIPIFAVVIGQYIQNREEKRKDKMEIFKTLMISRNGWNYQSVRALNIIDIVFADDKKVRAAWKNLYDKYFVENADKAQCEKIKQAEYKLIEAIAISLGYKNKVTWETIQNPYIPKGMIEEAEKQRMFQAGQLEWAKAAEKFNQQLGTSVKDKVSNENEENKNE